MERNRSLLENQRMLTATFASLLISVSKSEVFSSGRAASHMLKESGPKSPQSEVVLSTTRWPLQWATQVHIQPERVPAAQSPPKWRLASNLRKKPSLPQWHRRLRIQLTRLRLHRSQAQSMQCAMVYQAQWQSDSSSGKLWPKTTVSLSGRLLTSALITSSRTLAPSVPLVLAFAKQAMNRARDVKTGNSESKTALKLTAINVLRPL